MNRTRWMTCGVVLLLAVARAWASETVVVTRVALTLTDGSRVLGVCKTASLSVDWQGRELNLNPALLKQIQLSHGPAKTRINFANGDTMEVTLKSAAFPVETLFGTFAIKAGLVRTADFHVLGRQGAVVEEGLLLYYSFDNVIGDRVPDLSGNGNDGKIKGETVVEGKLGSGMEFARKTDHVEIKQIPGLKFDVNDDATLTMWWKGNGDITHTPLITCYHFGRGFGLAALPTEGYYIPSITHCYAKFSVRLESGEWHHVAVVKKGSTWNVYHDGRELNIGSSRNWPLMEDMTVDAPMLIGGCTIADWPAFSGCIDEVRIYRRALSLEEIRSLLEKK